MGVPAQPKAFLLMANKLDLRARRARGGQAVLGAVEDQDLAINGERGDDVWVLRLVPGLVDLARMVDLLGDVELDDRRLPGRCLAAVATDLTALLIIVARVRVHKLGKLYFRNLEVVGLVLCRVGSEKQSVDRVVLVADILDIGKPLGGQCWPLQRRA
jgi:hypothetical protein